MPCLRTQVLSAAWPDSLNLEEACKYHTIARDRKAQAKGSMEAGRALCAGRRASGASHGLNC